VSFEDLAHSGAVSEPVAGRLRTAPTGRRNVRFVFSGDEAGQGWGINQSFGGYRIYEAMRRVNPDFFIHSGDQIYADNPLQDTVKMPDGTSWTNIVTPAKSRVAQSLDDYAARGIMTVAFKDLNGKNILQQIEPDRA
jgi:alkaline phosphatase D